MSDDALLKVENVSKRFCRSFKRSLWYGLQDLGSEIDFLRNGEASAAPVSSSDVIMRREEFWAVQDVSFELLPGECLGLIGRNGAGKTTLLRMLNGLIKPDTGRIEMKGRVGALIALGAGFNPVLTGRENIYTTAAIMGLNASQISDRIDEIVDFSGINEFIDAPVQSYSSGMSVRLGFAIASSLECNLLILDEVLAVGDERFQLKCFERISNLLSRPNTCAILVSHQMQNIERICTQAMILEKGSISINSSDTAMVVDKYLSETLASEHNDAKIINAPNSTLEILSVKYSFSESAIVMTCSEQKNIHASSVKYLASYSLKVKGTDILRGTTNGTQKEVACFSDNTIKLMIPESIANIPGVEASVTLWEYDERRPCCWIQHIRLNDPSSKR